MDITINGQHGIVTYWDSKWHLADQPQAVMAQVRFDDGRVVLYHVNALPHK